MLIFDNLPAMKLPSSMRHGGASAAIPEIHIRTIGRNLCLRRISRLLGKHGRAQCFRINQRSLWNSAGKPLVKSYPRKQVCFSMILCCLLSLEAVAY